STPARGRPLDQDGSSHFPPDILVQTLSARAASPPMMNGKTTAVLRLNDAAKKFTGYQNSLSPLSCFCDGLLPHLVRSGDLRCPEGPVLGGIGSVMFINSTKAALPR